MPGQPTPPEIHEKKREIVQHVGAGNLVVEFDRVEERRPSVDQHDVAKVEIAVTLADESGFPTSIEQASMAIEGRTRVSCQFGRQTRVEDAIALLLESGGVAVDDPRHSGGAAMIRATLRSQVELRDCRRQRGHEPEIQSVATREAVEQRVLVESVHLDDPVDGHAWTAQGKRTVRSSY